MVLCLFLQWFRAFAGQVGLDAYPSWAGSESIN